MNIPAVEQVLATYRKEHFKLFDLSKPYNVNLLHIRSTQTISRYDDKFNDLLCLLYADADKRPVLMAHQGTTAPGAIYLGERLGNPQGTYILKSNAQYAGCWVVGMHFNYRALVQKYGYAGFEGHRDKNQNRKPDFTGGLYKDVQGLNCHSTMAGHQVENVGAFSAGCQVRKYWKDHLAFMQVIDKAASLYGSVFSLTLIDQDRLAT